MADTFREQLDEDMDNVFLGTTAAPKEFAASVTITDLSGTTTTTPAGFVFQVGAVDEKERAVFYIADDVTIARGFYITFLGEQWTAVDIRPDDLGMTEVRCDKPDTTS